MRLLESAAVSPLLNIASVATVVWWPSFVDLRACSIALRIAEFVGIPSKQSQKNSCRRVDRSEELRTESLHKALFGFYLPFWSSLVRTPVERDTLLVSLLAKQRGLHLRYPPTRRGPRSPTCWG